MRCWNCNHEISDSAKLCSRCEAKVGDEPTPEEMEIARALFEHLPADVEDDLHKVFQESSTAEEFANRIFVGDCPKCNSSNTDHCENDPDIDNLLVGRCIDCGQLWCTECCALLVPGKTECSCLDDEEAFQEECETE